MNREINHTYEQKISIYKRCDSQQIILEIYKTEIKIPYVFSPWNMLANSANERVNGES